MSDYLIKSGSGVVAFQQNHAYSQGDRMVVARGDTNLGYLTCQPYVWECTTAGTSAGANPSWPFSVTADVTTITSGGATFTARKAGYSSGSTMNWSFAHPYLNYMWGLGNIDGSSRLLVSNNHNESVSSSITLDVSSGYSQNNSLQVLCVNDSATPPTTLTTGAVFRANAITFDHWFHCYGIRFESATGGISGNISGSRLLFEKCQFVIDHATSTSIIAIAGGTVDAFEAIFIECDFRFGHASQGIVQASPHVNLTFIRCTLLSGGTAPTYFLSYSGGMGGGQAGKLFVDGFDFSNGAQGMYLIGGTSAYASGSFLAKINGVKFPSGWTGAIVSSDPYVAIRIDAYAYGTGANPQKRLRKEAFGSVESETTIVRTGGASDGEVPISWKMVTTANAQYYRLWLTSDDIVIRNDVVNSSLMVTVHFVHDSATALTDKDIWMDILYPKNSGDNLRGVVTSRQVNVLASTWDYESSNAVWTGHSFSNENKQKMAVLVTPQQAGPLIVQVRVAKASKTLYVCPRVEVVEQ
jgi:hypothetical protein